jgi:hypothetical protein
MKLFRLFRQRRRASPPAEAWGPAGPAAVGREGTNPAGEESIVIRQALDAFLRSRQATACSPSAIKT